MPSDMIPSSPGRKPNLVYLFADQLRADALGYAGNRQALTPHLDRLADDAVNFSNAVAVTPVCAAARASLLTGKYTTSTGMVINELNMNPNHRTLAHVLTEAGYALGYVGKMHLNDQHARSYRTGPERFGFDGYWAAYSFNHQSFDEFYHTDDAAGVERRVDLAGRYGPEEFTNLAMDFIRAQAGKDRPFAAFLSWNPPHDPWERANVLPRCHELFQDARFTLPENFRETPDPYMDRFPQEFFAGTTAWRQDFIAGGGYQEAMRCYHAMVHSIDEQVGRVVALLAELGIGEETIVVFTSDHGEMFTSQGRMYKTTFHTEAAAVPLLIRHPAAKHGRRTSEACINTPDLAPTLLGLLGLAERIPEEMEGADLSFIVRGEAGTEPPFAFLQGTGHTYQWIDGFEWRAIRSGRYTYARYLKDGAERLYDRRNDPHEIRDLSTSDGYADIRAHLRSAMAGKMADLQDGFHPCTWYRDRWMHRGYSIRAAARGEFGPLPPIEPQRTE